MFASLENYGNVERKTSAAERHVARKFVRVFSSVYQTDSMNMHSPGHSSADSITDSNSESGIKAKPSAIL